MSPLVKVENLRKSFGDNEILHGVDLEVDRGEVVSIIGPSGSGKTTILRCLNLLERPSGGRIEVDGRVLCEEGPDGKVKFASKSEIRGIREELGMVFQRFNLFPHMTALENIIEAPMAVKKIKRDAAISNARNLLESVGLADRADHYPLQLSGGQRQRVAIARALALDPAVMLFDEVTSSVDPELAGDILLVMKNLAEQGMTMIVVTHEMGFAADVSDRVLFIDHGLVVEQGPARELLGHPQHERTSAFLRAVLERAPMGDDDAQAPNDEDWGMAGVSDSEDTAGTPAGEEISRLETEIRQLREELAAARGQSHGHGGHDEPTEGD